MKKKFYLSILPFFILAVSSITAFATPNVKLTTSVLSAASVNQGINTSIVYAVKMDVTVQDVTINNIQFTLSGNHDNDDLGGVAVYFNPTSPAISGSSFLGSATANFAAPHTYSIGIFTSMPAGTSGYFIIAINVTTGATDNHTVQINGAANPVVFGYSASPVLNNTQSNIAGVQTIQAADITLTTSPIVVANINQGTSTNIVYAAKMNVQTEPAVVSNIQFVLDGTYDNTDIGGVAVYFNPTSPVISGSSFLGSAQANFAAPHTYSIGIFESMAAGTSGYFIITVNINAAASDNKSIFINGLTNPVVFGFTTSPNIVNNQTNKAKRQTIQAADITLTTSPIAVANVNQGTNTNIVYAAKMDVQTEPVVVNNIQFVLDGTYGNTDLGAVAIYFNPTSPVISGSSFLGSATANFAAPHTYSIGIFESMAAGTSGYFIITVNVNAGATDNHTIHINGATNPVIFGFTTSPNIADSQTNKAGAQSIQAADITLTTSPIAVANINQGTSTNIIYAAKMNVQTEPVVVNNIQFTLSGNHDNNDLGGVAVYFNPTSPVISGSSFLGSATANFAAPHTYSIGIFESIAAGTSGYFIITVNINAAASDNKTIFINGAVNPVVFGFTTSPNIANNQTNKAKAQTIQAADITLSTSNMAAGNIARGTNTNIIYAAKMDVQTEPVVVNNIQFVLDGTYGNTDLGAVAVYFNPTSPVISGSSFLGSATANFAAPHTYSIGIFESIAAGTSGYFIITVNVNSSATVGKTVKINGATEPVVFGFTTNPNIVNDQTNTAGTKTISATFALNGNTNADEDVAEKNCNYVLSGLFPNPANSLFNFTLTAKQTENVKVQLTGRSGNVLQTTNLIMNNGLNKYTINVFNIPNGVYYLVITNSNGDPVAKQQLVLQH